MAHDYVKDELQLDSTTGKLSFGIVATLAGGVLLLCSFIALLVFDNDVKAHAFARLLLSNGYRERNQRQIILREFILPTDRKCWLFR